MKHAFTNIILQILESKFKKNASSIYQASDLLKYLNQKTKSANRGSKSRGSFGNIYAIYVLVEDYVKKEYHKREGYSDYEGAQYSNLLTRMRSLPFGTKLQNHALNHRMNQEFKKYFPTCGYVPIIRDASTSKYWINEQALKIKISGDIFNIAECIIEIIDSYVETKQSSFKTFITTLEALKVTSKDNNQNVSDFIISLLAPKQDARIFEIASYAILKAFYNDQVVYFGYDLESIEEHNLKLYKTGRTNANDGGIDFVMRPLGRFFQVTETTDVKKYFLDIDKVQKFPISFVIKSEETVEKLNLLIKKQAIEQYTIKVVVKKYMDCIGGSYRIRVKSSHKRI